MTNQNTDLLLLYVTFASNDEARHVASSLLEEKLITCANILAESTSLYMWEGKQEETTEASVIFKSLASKKEALMRRIESLHGYDCPCVIELANNSANDAFVDWVHQAL